VVVKQLHEVLLQLLRAHGRGTQHGELWRSLYRVSLTSLDAAARQPARLAPLAEMLRSGEA
jgi:hypothetical protein